MVKTSLSPNFSINKLKWIFPLQGSIHKTSIVSIKIEGTEVIEK